MIDELTIDLISKDFTITAKALYSSLAAVDKMLKSVSREPGAEIIVSNLYGGSAHVTYKAPPEDISIIKDGFSCLRERSFLPDHWSEETLKTLIELHDISTKTNLESIAFTIGETIERIDSTIYNNACDVRLPKNHESLGGVAGIIYRYLNDNNKRSAAIKTFNCDDHVTITFPDSLTSQIRENIDRKVRINGILSRDRFTNRPIKIHAQKITPLNTKVVTIQEMNGVLGSNWYGDIDSVEWVRSLRD